MITASFFDSFIDSLTEDFLSIILQIFSWIKSFFVLVLDLFLGLFSDSSFIGRYVVDFFDDIMSNGFSVNIIYYFFGAVIIVYIFRRLWDLIP